MTPAKITQYMVLAAMTMAAFFAIVVMQSKFDGADQKAAVGIVQSTRAPNGHTIVDALDVRHPGKTATWSVATESACFQHERVRAAVSESPTSEPIAYDFVVDINGPSVHPGNAAGEALMKQLGEMPTATPSAEAPPSATPSATGTTN